MATVKKIMFVAHAARAGCRCPDSPRVGNTSEQNSIPAERKIATATPPPGPLREKEIPSGAANKTITRQIAGCAQRKCHQVRYARLKESG